MDPYAQLGHRVRLEWGPVGAAETAAHSTYAVVVAAGERWDTDDSLRPLSRTCSARVW
jgi:hypothetical protein